MHDHHRSNPESPFTHRPRSLLLKPQKSWQLIDGRRYRDTARANTAGHQRNGSGNPWRSRPDLHPHPSRQRNSLHQSPKKSPAEARPTEAAKTLTKRRPPPAASRPTAARRRRPRARRAPASRRSARPRPGRRARRPRSRARSRPSARPTPRRRRRRRPRRSRLLILNSLGRLLCRARLERRCRADGDGLRPWKSSRRTRPRMRRATLPTTMGNCGRSLRVWLPGGTRSCRRARNPHHLQNKHLLPHLDEVPDHRPHPRPVRSRRSARRRRDRSRPLPRRLYGRP